VFTLEAYYGDPAIYPGNPLDGVPPTISSPNATYFILTVTDTGTDDASNGNSGQLDAYVSSTPQSGTLALPARKP
jgi:hypothetical protein